MEWVVTSDEGRKSMSQDMGFVAPFDTFTGEYQSANPFVQIDAQYTAEGKTPGELELRDHPVRRVEERRRLRADRCTLPAPATGTL